MPLSGCSCRRCHDHPEVADFPAALGIVHNNLGNLMVELGRTSEAARHYQVAITIQRQLAHDDSSSSIRRLDLARTLGNFG